MNLHFTCIAVFVPLFALVGASDAAQCCYPMKLSGEASLGDKHTLFYMDYERGMILEDHGGLHKTDRIIIDLNKEKTYRIRTDGVCTEYPMTSDSYARCMPDDTEEVESDEHEVTYSYQLHGSTVLKTLEKDTCLPIKLTRTIRDRNLVVEFDAHSGIDDESVFNVDLSHCTRY